MRDILFVDDEPNVLDGLRRMLYPFHGEWRMKFATSGAEALQSLAANPCDVIVADMRMPGMTGSELLSKVARQYPQVVRIVLSGMCDQEFTVICTASAHQYLAKPCDARTLQAAVNRALGLRTMLADSPLKTFISQLRSLPSLPAAYMQLLEAVHDPEVHVRRLGRIMSRDIAMTAKVLHLANSPLFGLRRTILDPGEACAYLGVDTIKALVLSLAVFSQFNQTGLSHFSVGRLETHSFQTGVLAKRISQFEQLPRSSIDEAFLGGLLHDVGKLVLVTNYPREYDGCVASSEETGEPVTEAERQAFGITHAEAGMYLLRLWELPDVIAETAALHHRPRESVSTGFGPLAAVHIADALQYENGSQLPLHLDMEYLTALQVVQKLPDWRALKRLPADGAKQ